MMNRHSRLSLLAFMLFSATVYGCAKVTIRKIPTPTQYTHWTDKMQHKADRMEGIRFYLPRPFVQVRQSFPIRTETFIAHGRVSADGKYVVVGAVDASSALAKYVATGSNRALIQARDVVFPSAISSTDASTLAKAQSAAIKEQADARKASAEKKFDIGVDGKRQPNQSTVVRQSQTNVTDSEDVTILTGQNTKKTTNDNQAYAVQPLRGENFDIVYMPDFEEQYAVSSKAGLGNAKFEVNLGQGWSLQGFNSLSDNSELNKRIFDLIDKSIELADKASNAGLDKFLGDLQPGQSKTVGPKAQSGKITDRAKAIPGTEVTLKITVVYYAAKGLYPVMKPREMQERLTGTQVSFSAIDLFKLKPKVMGISDFDPSAIKRAQVAVANESTDFTVPKYPYQFISFNTFNYMAIEVVRNTENSSGPFKYLYPEKGTTRNADLAKPDPGNITINGSRGPGSKGTVRAAIVAIQKKAEELLPGIKRITTDYSESNEEFTVTVPNSVEQTTFGTFKTQIESEGKKIAADHGFPKAKVLAKRQKTPTGKITQGDDQLQSSGFTKGQEEDIKAFLQNGTVKFNGVGTSKFSIPPPPMGKDYVSFTTNRNKKIIISWNGAPAKNNTPANANLAKILEAEVTTKGLGLTGGNIVFKKIKP